MSLLELLSGCGTLEHLGHVAPAHQLRRLLPDALLVARVEEEAPRVSGPHDAPRRARHRRARHRPRLVLAAGRLVRRLGLDVLLAEDSGRGLGGLLLLVLVRLLARRLQEGRGEEGRLLDLLLRGLHGAGARLQPRDDHAGAGVIQTDLLDLEMEHRVTKLLTDSTIYLLTSQSFISCGFSQTLSCVSLL